MPFHLTGDWRSTILLDRDIGRQEGRDIMNWTIWRAGSTYSAWTPGFLFAAAQTGYWYDTADLSTMYRNAGNADGLASLEPAEVGDPIARIEDKSPNGNHIEQTTGALRPTLGQSGSLYYLVFQENQHLQADFVLPTGFDRMSGFYVEPLAGNYIYSAGPGGSHTGELLIVDDGGTPRFAIFDGLATIEYPNAPATNDQTIIFERHKDVSSAIAVNEDGFYEPGTNTGTDAPGGLTVGTSFDDGVPTEDTPMLWFGAVCVNYELSSLQLLALRSYFEFKMDRRRTSAIIAPPTPILASPEAPSPSTPLLGSDGLPMLVGNEV